MRPVLYLHDDAGAPGDPLPRRLREASLPVLTPDGRGREPDRRAADLVLLLEGRPDAVLVGVGSGARVALEAAAGVPDAVAGLVLLDPPADPASPLPAPPATVKVVVLRGVAVAVAAEAPSDDPADPMAEVVRVVLELAAARGPARSTRTPNRSPEPRTRSATPRTPTPRPPPVVPPVVVATPDLDGAVRGGPLPFLDRWSPKVPPALGRPLSGRLADLRAAVADQGAIVVGYGAGARVAVALAADRGVRVRGLLLLAPDLAGDEPAIPPGLPAIAVVGSRDFVAAPDGMATWGARNPAVRVTTVDDGHELSHAEAAVASAVRELVSAASRR